jgi:hypothetical protein
MVVLGSETSVRVGRRHEQEDGEGLRMGAAALVSDMLG